MPRKVIEVGVEGNDGTGDGIREAFIKSNDNFQELYAISGGQFSSSLSNSTGYVEYSNGTTFVWGSGTTDGAGNYIAFWSTIGVTVDSIKSITVTPRTDQKAIAIVSQSDTSTFTITTYKITDGTAISVPFTWFAVVFNA